MLDRLTKNLLLGLLSLAISSCTNVNIPDVKVCAVAGIMAAGADCAYTLSDETEEMTLNQFVEFLEPQAEKPDPADPTKVIPARGPALCQSTEDYTKIKIALEQACKKLGSSCSKKMRDSLKKLSAKLTKLTAQKTNSKIVHPIFMHKGEK